MLHITWQKGHSLPNRLTLTVSEKLISFLNRQLNYYRDGKQPATNSGWVVWGGFWLVGWFLESEGGKPSQTTTLARIQIQKATVLEKYRSTGTLIS